MKEWADPDKHERRSRRHQLQETLLAALSLGVWLAILVFAYLAWASPAAAHGGRLAADGCHNDRKTGTRHCHRGENAGPQRQQDGSVYYPNCAAARAAGATPIRRGQPGYGRRLDRDGDGVACE